MVYTPATKHPNGARLLALDGGGVRGIVALELLNELMTRIKTRKQLETIPRPADYFELAAGTSTGGIIGIMLFRLRMTAKETIDEYDKIAAGVFSPKIYGFNIGRYLPVKAASFINSSKNLVQSSRFDDADLRKAIDDVVGKYGLDENDRRLKGDAPLHHPEAGRAYVVTSPSSARCS
jgi:patatin-like phospholipase/acyl hydrolase